MTAFATLNGVQIATGKLYVPRVGMWVADIALNSDSLETGPCSIVLGNLTLAGAVFRSDPFAGQTRVCAVGGAAGWRNQVAAKPYGNPNGVSLGTVLGDAAGEVGRILGDQEFSFFHVLTDAVGADAIAVDERQLDAERDVDQRREGFHVRRACVADTEVIARTPGFCSFVHGISTHPIAGLQPAGFGQVARAQCVA